MSGIQDDNDLPMQLAGHKVGMLAKLVPVLQPTTLCGDVAEMLNADLSLSTIVVKGEGDGFGLVDRATFLPRFLERYNREIYQRKPITQLMDAEPLVVSEDTQIERVALIVTTERPELLKSAFIITANGTYHGIGFGVDLMRAVALRAEANSTAKSSFLANMSHEIRTPLNAVIGNLELLDQTRMNEEQHHLASMAKISANALLDLIGDLLDLSKIEADRFDMEKIETDLHLLVEETLAITRPRARQKGLNLICHVGQDVPIRILGDPVRLRQILVNFIGNAVKFTESGTIMLALTTRELTTDYCQLRFDVIDTGIGFDPARAEALFEPFVQEDMTTTRRFGGTGLGLTISKRIAEALGGRVGCSTEPGLGSSFWCSIPAKIIAMPERRPLPSWQNRKVLLLGASSLWQDKIRSSLLTWNITCDQEMPVEDMSGYPAAIFIISEGDTFNYEDITKLMRHVEYRLVIIEKSDAKSFYRAYRAGASFVLRNPQSLDRLPSLLLEPTAHNEVVDRAQSDAANKIKKWSLGQAVLVIDDTATNRELAARQLRHLGISCELAENGQVGLDMVSSRDYALILVDGSMPVMDGSEFARHFRILEQQRGIPRTPVIAMTAHALAGDAERFISAGMDDYLAKPVTLQKLDSTLRRWLSDNIPDSSTSVQPQISLSIKDAVDLKQLGSIMGSDDPQYLGELLQIFIDDFPELLKHVDEGLLQNDRQALARAAHAGKSAAGSASAIRLAELMSKLEKGALTDNITQIQQIYAAALKEFELVSSFIAQHNRFHKGAD